MKIGKILVIKTTYTKKGGNLPIITTHQKTTPYLEADCQGNLTLGAAHGLIGVLYVIINSVITIT